ncbi:heme NO-binding domain-containing protein [Flavobacterium sp. RHBU_24]|uniref:heme NO-binding domain-containing protein n=1 Tax=Flavobacterium sp. RHBU_24 TaxID=3391185 RepID=UPI00398546EC
MYGVIYIAIKEYAETAFGPVKWQSIVEKSGVTVDFTLTEQPYNDDISYKLAKATADCTGMLLQNILYNFGLQVIRTTNASFKPIMSGRGESLRDYLLNLPNFHNRISFIYPELMPPEFRLSDINDISLMFHYRKKREGMTEYFRGYLTGLAEVYKENVTITAVSATSDTEEVYKITW